MRDEEILVSVIIPVYNVEKYLENSIDSVCAQSHRNLEIILVNDGSTDSSGELCDLAAEKDKRITVLHKHNGGVSAARNWGLDHAHGQYVSFMDSDDVYAPYAVEALLRVCREHDAEIAVGDYQDFKEDPVLFDKKPSSAPQVYHRREALMQMIGKDHIKYTLVNNKIYRADIFKNLRFLEGKIHEDEDFMYQAIYQAEKIVDLHQTVYGYRSRPESITTSDYSEKRMSVMEIARKRTEFFKAHGEDKLAVQFQWVYAMLLLQHYPRVKKDLKRPDLAKRILAEYRKTAPELLRSPVLNRKKRMMVWFFRLVPSWYAPMMDWREKSIKHDRN